MAETREQLLRGIPAVDTLLQEPRLEPWLKSAPRWLVVETVRQATAELRQLLSGDGVAPAKGCGAVTEADLPKLILDRSEAALRAAAGPYFRKVINATGIILHTGLGRAVLAKRALKQIAEQLDGYSLLQMGAETGKRSGRDEHIEWLLQKLTGAEAATVVNNNAAATMLVLNTVGQGKEVIVSRGQLVEIGGSFRLPDVMAASGARMVEVGTTNKTHLKDYERAITPETAAILRVHPSNYKIYGFTSEVPLDELAALAHARGLVMIDDVGAGALVDLSRFGFADQPPLSESIRGGADLTTSSTDKLIGSSQGGLVLGRAALIEKVRKNPLSRILRVGKLTLAALEATLSLFLDEATALREVPTLAMLLRPLAEIDAQAKRIAETLKKSDVPAQIETIDGQSQMGSGSLPTQNIPTRLVAITPKGLTAEALARALRSGEPPVFARIHQDQLLLDPRTLLEGEEPRLVAALQRALKQEPTA